MPTCDEIRHLIDLIAFDAAEPEERAQVEAHLATCADCRTGQSGRLPLTTALALSVPQLAPPPVLRARILAEVRGGARAPIAPPWWRRLFPRPLPAAVGAAAVATLAFAASLAWNVTLQAQLAQVSRSASAMTAVAPIGADEYGSTWSLGNAQMRRLVGSEAAPEARGWIYVDPRDDNALLVAYKLPPLDPDRAYQLWLVADGQRASGGLFTVDAEGYGWLKVRSPRSFGAYQRVGITVEPRGGSPGPTGARVLGGDL